MKDKSFPHERLETELTVLRQRISELEHREEKHVQIEKELRALKEFNENIIQNMAEGIVVQNEKGDLTFVNPAAAKLLGYQVEQLINQHWTLITPEDQHAIIHAADKRRTQGDTDRYDIELLRNDGERISVQISASPLSQPTESHFPGSFAVFTDLTEHKRSEQKLLQRNRELSTLFTASAAVSSNLSLDTVLQTVAEQMTRALAINGCAISLWRRDADCLETVIDYNTVWPSKIEPPGTIHALGKYPATRRALVNRQPLIVQANDPKADLAELQLLESYEVHSLLLLPLVARDHVLGLVELLDDVNTRYFTADEIRLAESLTSQAAVAIQNARLYDQAQKEIATRKRAESELQHLQHQLQEANLELALRIDELAHSNAELQYRNQELDAFAHTVAHDLKNPLATMIGYSNLLRTSHSDFSEAEYARYMTAIEKNGRKMNNIIEELLLLASVRELESVELVRVDMQHIVQEAQRRLSYLLDKHRVEIIAPDHWPKALGHEPWVEEIWANFISNAIKYGGDPAHIELGATKLPDGHICFWVRDNGKGLTKEEQSKLFSPFTRLDHVRAKGYGLGLSITQRIAEKLGGRVGVESKPGQGSTFSFTLPSAE